MDTLNTLDLTKEMLCCRLLKSFFCMHRKCLEITTLGITLATFRFFYGIFSFLDTFCLFVIFRFFF